LAGGMAVGAVGAMGEGRCGGSDGNIAGSGFATGERIHDLGDPDDKG